MVTYHHLATNSALTDQAKCIFRYSPYYSTFEHLLFHSSEHRFDYGQTNTINNGQTNKYNVNDSNIIKILTNVITQYHY